MAGRSSVWLRGEIALEPIMQGRSLVWLRGAIALHPLMQERSQTDPTQPLN
ncbi:MAG: hypothetical protein LH702_31380 [Phormidesmis sp. CAN_BIN44]|nr:hypothetical protein [Phormidesmis sp. CAN_BIN44]